MKYKNDRNLKNIDLQMLRRKGLSIKKISKMLGVSTKKVERHLKYQNRIREYSGVF
ncbi:MAG: hypothetical protein HN737_12955 [Desulfobacterales bacterium]|nr:hypothetical protein [Desulfobacteraceae bacterium]MBT4365138.1 hypothetical protein [Desulfobacteraceae bacterium]MBT7698305.1 hypothetical protein [Desulfobacterales bacterium]